MGSSGHRKVIFDIAREFLTISMLARKNWTIFIGKISSIGNEVEIILKTVNTVPEHERD